MNIGEFKQKFIKKQNFMTIIGFKEEDKEALEKMFKDIYAKDKTFIFKIKKSKYKNSDWVVFVNSESLDKAHRRGTWIVNKYKDNTRKELLYEVREQNGK